MEKHNYSFAAYTSKMCIVLKSNNLPIIYITYEENMHSFVNTNSSRRGNIIPCDVLLEVLF